MGLVLQQAEGELLLGEAFHQVGDGFAQRADSRVPVRRG